jgi:hypothetical protein
MTILLDKVRIANENEHSESLGPCKERSSLEKSLALFQNTKNSPIDCPKCKNVLTICND